MEEPIKTQRADKYLHHVRIYKTRTLATRACDDGQVLVGGQPLKPSRELRPGDVLDVTRGELRLVLRVLDVPDKRLSPPQVPAHCENLTPKENFEHAAEARRERQLIEQYRPQPASKKDLRLIRQLLGRE